MDIPPSPTGPSPGYARGFHAVGAGLTLLTGIFCGGMIFRTWAYTSCETVVLGPFRIGGLDEVRDAVWTYGLVGALVPGAWALLAGVQRLRWWPWAVGCAVLLAGTVWLGLTITLPSSCG
jgi:hypothetical protein